MFFKKSVLSKLQGYKLSPQYSGHVDNDDYQCLATIIDSEGVECPVMEVNSDQGSLSYDGGAYTLVEVEYAQMRAFKTITVHNNRNSFQYNSQYLFLLLDNPLCRRIRLMFRSVRRFFLNCKACFIKIPLTHETVRKEIIRYQNHYSNKGFRTEFVSAEGLAKFTHSWLFEISPRHPKCAQLVKHYHVSMESLASNNELFGGWNYDVPSLPLEIDGRLRIAEEDSKTAKKRHLQYVFIGIIPSIGGAALPLLF